MKIISILFDNTVDTSGLKKGDRITIPGVQSEGTIAIISDVVDPSEPVIPPHTHTVTGVASMEVEKSDINVP